MKRPKYNLTTSPASDMSTKELCNWFALCNCLKFIDLQSKKTGIVIKEADIDTTHIKRYIKTTAGDMEYGLNHRNGIPYKYSLDVRNEEARDISEIIYN